MCMCVCVRVCVRACVCVVVSDYVRMFRVLCYTECCVNLHHYFCTVNCCDAVLSSLCCWYERNLCCFADHRVICGWREQGIFDS